ncbi:DUF4139 domain-containing protein [Sphingosinithalassobacter portus]|uniref:DUF4139 domain-containing protein n=1 Tax=Stakelama portus TaxID=2676234 RepID=UPI001EFE8348|nr:hypothetical protein [Sphingosinithalassobacter portus]
MRMLRPFILTAALLAATPVVAQTMVTSDAPGAVAVTIYRAPDREPDERMQLNWLEGYALVSETRTIDIPAGRSVIRFEGVAAGMLPESAIVTGLPAEVREKNLDADLLSPRSLYARSFGRPVTIRRVGEGSSAEERAIIRSGPDGAAILQTQSGFEALDCGPTDDSIVYDGVPEGLSAKPTLSVQIDSPRAGRATVQLSYLAWGFDWQANYVATLDPDGNGVSLTGWVTLASSDSTSFPDAETMVVAGEVNREDEREYQSTPPTQVRLRCFATPLAPQMAPAPPSPPPPPMAAPAQEIVVTGYRASFAQDAVMVSQEELGDLKLYRVPMPTNVAAMSQKQVALLQRDMVKLDLLYRFDAEGEDDGVAAQIILRGRNREADGLGLPLPAGPVALFRPYRDTRLLIGEGAIDDTAIDGKIDIEVADEATQLVADIEDSNERDDRRDREVTMSNALPVDVAGEAMLGETAYYRISRFSGPGRVIERDGKFVWVGTLPANAATVIRFRIRDR